MNYSQYIYSKGILMKLIDDILKTDKDGERRFSQSRIYLFICLLVQLAILTIQFTNDWDIETVKMATDNLYYLILIFSTYALGEKGIQSIKNKLK